MKNIIIDTNIFISGLLGGKTTRPIIKAFINKKFHLIISRDIKEELVRVLAIPKISKRIPFGYASELVELIELNSIKA